MRVFFGLALVLLIAACASESGMSKYEMGSNEYGPVPSADPSRVVSDQDCTKQVTLDGGNLRCK